LASAKKKTDKSKIGERSTAEVLASFLRSVAVGTILASCFLLSTPLLKEAESVLDYLYAWPLPVHALDQAVVVVLSLTLITIFMKLPWKIWRSLRLGLIPVGSLIWAPATTVFWIAFDWRYYKTATASLTVALLITAAAWLVNYRKPADQRQPTTLLEMDLPVAEDGTDLLGRQSLIEELVSAILIESPPTIAVTGEYGDGKTSFVNLAIGELRRSEEFGVPLIVKFSPWLAGDSNALILSMLNSIVAEIKRTFVVPGLTGDATRFARTLLSALPRMERLKDLVAERSQEDRIDALVDRIAKLGRRILVVLDDLDRMQARELETVLKLLRGSDKLSNLTFLCLFSPTELALILKKTRPHQDTAIFIEKFFPVTFRLPLIDAVQLQDFLSQGVNRILEPHALEQGAVEKGEVERMWKDGADTYFRNLRRLKLFLNKISRSLQLVAHEVNIGDFINLELIRDIAPTLYEQIYNEHEWFWNRDFAFEASFEGPDPLDRNVAKKEREAFYEKVKNSLPPERQYVFRFVERLFPQFAIYEKIVGAQTMDAKQAERTKRICHPRCFRQYFLLKVPSELFPQKRFREFVSNIELASEEAAMENFSKTFRSLLGEDFKRWHFMHLIDGRFDDFKLQVDRGLCRGMARNSELWSTDAFELMIAVRRTREVLQQDVNSRDLLTLIISESSSDLYTMTLIWRIEEALKKEGTQSGIAADSSQGGATQRLIADIAATKIELVAHFRARYLGSEAPSVFEQFGNLSSGAARNRIEPVWLLLAWRSLGPTADSDQKEYLRRLFRQRPQDLDNFLGQMFRVEFLDDYANLKPLFDYKELCDLINSNESSLDPEKVKKFRERFKAESSSDDPEVNQ
jgi:hypothetical protein